MTSVVAEYRGQNSTKHNAGTHTNTNTNITSQQHTTVELLRGAVQATGGGIGIGGGGGGGGAVREWSRKRTYEAVDDGGILAGGVQDAVYSGAGGKRFRQTTPGAAASYSSWTAGGAGSRFEAVAVLRARFPHMDEEALQNVLHVCGNDVEEAIRRIEQLCVSQQQQQEEEQKRQLQQEEERQHRQREEDDARRAQAAQQSEHTKEGLQQQQQQQQQEGARHSVANVVGVASVAGAAGHGHEAGIVSKTTDAASGSGGSAGGGQGHSVSAGVYTAPGGGGVGGASAAPAATVPAPAACSGEAFVEALVSEMTRATDVEDARSRARKVLKAIEAAVTAAVEPALRQQSADLLRDSAILKRALKIQMSKEAERTAEVDALRRQMESYKEQLARAELSNYSLAVHLREATAGANRGAPGDRPHPDVF